MDPLEPWGELYKDYIGVLMGLYRDLMFRFRIQKMEPL